MNALRGMVRLVNMFLSPAVLMHPPDREGGSQKGNSAIGDFMVGVSVMTTTMLSQTLRCEGVCM